MRTFDVVRAKTAVISLEMNPPEMRKARIERAKRSIMLKIMEDHPADRYEEVVFWVVPPPIERAYELARKYKREDDGWYLCGERVTLRDVLDHVQENYVIVEGEAKVWRAVPTIGASRAEKIGFSSHDADTMYRCSACGGVFCGWDVHMNAQKRGTNYCPHCERELKGLE